MLLDAQRASSNRNGAALWRYLKQIGYSGSIRVVGEQATRRRMAEKATDHQLQKVQLARSIARLMTTARDDLGKAGSWLYGVCRVPTNAVECIRNLMFSQSAYFSRSLKAHQ